jgi:membrane protease YdiL (CAAX protease family)
MNSPPIRSTDDGEYHADAGRPRRKDRLDLERIREVSWTVLLVTVLASSALVTTLWYLLSISWRPLLTVETVARTASGGLVHLTLVTYAVLLLVVVVGVMGWVGGLRPRDVGLDIGDLPVGVGVTVGTWVVLQLVGVASLVVQGQPIEINSYWTAANTLAVLGLLAAQLFGNALYEEVVFRAFLINQLRHKLGRRLPSATPRRIAIAAILVSQVVFALSHIPSRLVGYPPSEVLSSLITVFVVGLLLAVLYWRTGNLFVAIGLHALINTPTMVYGSPSLGGVTALVVAVGLALGWPWAERGVRTTRRTETSVPR